MEIDFDKYPYPKLRHHTSANMYFPASDLEILPRGYPPLYDEIEWSERFANANPPDILDIGCGKGVFLLQMAELHPEKNLLGIELRKGAVKWINSVVEGETIPNCSALWYSVINGMNFIDDNSIEKIFYLFPDPWPKRKQQKRRLFREPFINDCHRALKDDGVLYLATDLDYVHEHHLNELERSGKFNYNEIKNRDDWPLPYTNKENFCKRKDIEVHRLICTKK